MVVRIPSLTEFNAAQKAHEEIFARSLAKLLPGEVTSEQVMQAIRVRRALMSSSPEEIIENVQQSAQLIGVSATAFTGWALRCPSLFRAEPELLAEHARYLRQLLVHYPDRTFEEFIEGTPTYLVYGTPTLQARLIVAEQGLDKNLLRRSLHALLQIPTHEIEQAIVGHYTKRLADGGEGVPTLEGIQRQRIIPEDVPAR